MNFNAVFDKWHLKTKVENAQRIYDLQIALEATFKVVTSVKFASERIKGQDVRKVVRRVLKEEHDFSDREYLENFLRAQ